MSDLDTGRTDGQPFDPTDLWVRTTAGAPPSIDGAASDSFAAETPVAGPSVAAAPVDDPPTGAGWRLRAGEASVALVALVLNAWALDRNGFGNAYYAAAARSMTQGWKNFFFGALDPGGWITVDKPPAALWLQAASAKVFGYSSWSLLLPSAVAGAGAVWLLTVTIRRVWGRSAGLVAGAALALTPVVVAVSRSNNPDGVLMLATVAAAWATERSITTRRARWMIVAGALCGFGFLTKLLAAGIVMPGLWLGYLVAARHPWRRRVVHLLAAAAAFAAVAGVWIGAVQLTPATDRPYIGGSTDGTALDLVLGYNGLGRVTGNEAAGAPGGPPRGVGFPGAGGGTAGFSVDQFGGTPGIGRLFNNGMGDQVMWLAPAAGLAVAAGTVVALRRRRIDARLGSLVLWAGWAAVTYVLFAFAKGVYHNYYVSLLAPAVAALVGVGVSLARSAGRVGRAVVAAGLLATAAVQVVLLRRIPSYASLRWLVPLGLALVAAAWVGLAVRRSPVRRRAIVGALVAGAGVALVAPGVWAVNGVRTAQSGSFPDARPALAGAGQAGPGGALGGGFGGGFGGAGGAGGGLTEAMLAWLRSQRTTERWIVAVSSSLQADSAIIGGDSVMPIGGFSGSDDSLSAARLADLVEGGELRFVLAGGGFGGFGGAGAAGGVTSVVTSACTAVPSSTWGGTGTGALYDCAGRAGAIRTAGASSSTTSPAATGQPAGAVSQPAGAVSPPAGFEQFASCMQANGVTLTAGGPPDLADPAVAKAMRACAAYAPGG